MATVMTLMTRSLKYVMEAQTKWDLLVDQPAMQVLACVDGIHGISYVDHRISPGRTKDYVGTPWCLQKSHAFITVKHLNMSQHMQDSVLVQIKHAMPLGTHMMT